MPYRPTEHTRRQAALKREELLRAATRLVAAHGFVSTTVTAVTRACNVSSGSLYSHFDSRDEFPAEVFRLAANHELAAVRQAIGSSAAEPERRLTAMIEAFADQDVTLAAGAVIGAISESLVGRLAPLGSDELQRTTDTQTVAGIEAFCLRALDTREPEHVTSDHSAASDRPHAIALAPALEVPK